MNKMYKNTKWFIEKLFNTFITLGVNVFIPQDKKTWVFGFKSEFYKSEIFANNSKYLFLHLLNENDIKANWLCDNQQMLKKFKQYKLNTYSRKSVQGILSIFFSKYCFFDISATQVSRYFSFISKKTFINLWHGIPLKKIGEDISKKHSNLNSIQKLIYKLLNEKTSYYIVNSEYEQSCYETAFLTSKDKIKILGSPRLDVLLRDIPHSDLFMEEEFANIKAFKEQGKKIFFYTPTFRDTGKDISRWLKSDKLKQFLKINNAILVCKLHSADINSLNFKLPEEFYKMDNNSDIYPVLKYSDALITDYSSIYFDYLLLDKPILYYPIDLEEYQEKCRGFYRPYEELTAGIKSYNEDELISAMQDVINGVDNYKKERKILRDKMFKYQDGRNCERVIEWIRSLDK